MVSKKTSSLDEEFNNSLEYKLRSRNRKNLIIFSFKRIFNSLTILHGSITILVLILFIPTLNPQQSIEFYLYFSLIILISYGLILLIIHLLQKSYIKPVHENSTEQLKNVTKINPEMAMELLQGKTLQVYWYIFTHSHGGIREIQKALNFSSSGTVAYQITKLLKAGIISKDDSEGKYSINKEIKIGILKFFIRIGNRMVPRISFYLIPYILGFTVYLILAFIQGVEFITNPLSLFLLIFLIIGTIIFVIESYKIWKLNPTK
ncbi:MAG: hypothetical protein ACW98D_05600 [Promethearchaeota archaeon]|jgi:hypothetical protein